MRYGRSWRKLAVLATLLTLCSHSVMGCTIVSSKQGAVRSVWCNKWNQRRMCPGFTPIQQIPVHRVSCRVLAFLLWFDDECRTAKRVLRLSESCSSPWSSLRRHLLPTAPSTTGMSPSCVRRSPRSGPSSSMLSSRSHVSSGSRLINCLAEAKILCHLTLMRLPPSVLRRQGCRCSGSYCACWWTSVHSSHGRVWAPSLYSSHTDWDHWDGAGSAWQAVLVWPSADVATQEEQQRACAVLVLVVLLVPRPHRCSVTYEVCIHYADSKECWLGFVRSEIVSADFESLGTFQAAWMFGQ